jgi:hypothetical protein
MAQEKRCALERADLAPACKLCKVDNKSVEVCAAAHLTDEQIQDLVVPPMGGPKFVEALAELLQRNFQNMANEIGALLKLSSYRKK